MTVGKADLESQLLDYRKASRALMWYWDSSQKLYELILESLELMDLAIEDGELEEEVKYWDRPKGVSSEAFTAITVNQNDWIIECCSEDDFTMKRDSFYLKIYMNLDSRTKESPENSLSALQIYGYHVKNAKGKAIEGYSDAEDSFNEKLINEDSGIDSDGEILKPMELKIFPNIWSAKNEKYKGDYAAGLYDLSDLVDEDAVLNTVIVDIKTLVDGWSKV